MNTDADLFELVRRWSQLELQYHKQPGEYMRGMTSGLDICAEQLLTALEQRGKEKTGGA